MGVGKFIKNRFVGNFEKVGNSEVFCSTAGGGTANLWLPELSRVPRAQLVAPMCVSAFRRQDAEPGGTGQELKQQLGR
jgi:hypothetical protein